MASVLLHLVVITLAFAVLRRFAVSTPVAGAIVLIFAVHPVHCESVAWISGAPDLILGTALLGSLWFVNLLGEKTTPLRWALSIGLYLVALGAKEVAILYPLIVVAVLCRGDRDPGEKERFLGSDTVDRVALRGCRCNLPHNPEINFGDIGTIR